MRPRILDWSAVMHQRLSTIFSLTVLVLGFPEIARAQTLTSLRLGTTVILGGGVSTGGVFLSNPAPSDGLVVRLASSNQVVVQVPASVIVPAGATSANFPVTTVAVAQSTVVTITAARGSEELTAELNVRAPQPSLIAFQPSALIGSGSSAATVNLSSPAPAAGLVLQLSSSDAAVVQVPASVIVKPGAMAASFTVTTAPVVQSTPVTVTVTGGGASQTAQLTVVAPTPSVAIAPVALVGGGSSTATITLNGPAPAAGLVVQLSSSSTAAALVPPSVTVPASSRTVSFPVATFPVPELTPVTITATGGSGSRTAVLSVVAPEPSAIALAPSSLVGGGSSTATVTLSGPSPSAGLVVQLSTSKPFVVQVPASVTVPARAATASFPVTTQAVAQFTGVTITATGGSGSSTAILNVEAPKPSALALVPSALTGGRGSTATVTLSGPAPAGFVIELSSSVPMVAAVPLSVAVARGGGTTVQVAITTVPVAQSTAVTITARVDGASRTAQLTVAPSVPSSFTLAPRTVTGQAYGSATTTGTVTLTGPAPAGGRVVQLSSGIYQAMVTVPPAVTVPAGETTVNFGIVVLPLGSGGGPPLTVTLTATAGEVSKTVQLTVNRI